MIVIIGDQRRTDGYEARSIIETPFGNFVPGEVVEAPVEIAEWLIHTERASAARNWRWPGEKKAPVPVPERFL